MGKFENTAAHVRNQRNKGNHVQVTTKPQMKETLYFYQVFLQSQILHVKEEHKTELMSTYPQYLKYKLFLV